jgi:hypothetical protein
MIKNAEEFVSEPNATALLTRVLEFVIVLGREKQ